MSLGQIRIQARKRGPWKVSKVFNRNWPWSLKSSEGIQKIFSFLKSALKKNKCFFANSTRNCRIGKRNYFSETISFLQKHTGEGLHECEKCGFRFVVRGHLNRHYKARKWFILSTTQNGNCLFCHISSIFGTRVVLTVVSGYAIRLNVRYCLRLTLNVIPDAWHSSKSKSTVFKRASYLRKCSFFVR